MPVGVRDVAMPRRSAKALALIKTIRQRVAEFSGFIERQIDEDFLE